MNQSTHIPSGGGGADAGEARGSPGDAEHSRVTPVPGNEEIRDIMAVPDVHGHTNATATTSTVATTESEYHGHLQISAEPSSRSATPNIPADDALHPRGSILGPEGYVAPSSYLRRDRGYSKTMMPPQPKAPETAVDREQRHALVCDDPSNHCFAVCEYAAAVCERC